MGSVSIMGRTAILSWLFTGASVGFPVTALGAQAERRRSKQPSEVNTVFLFIEA
jgi:hypothetical protein